MGDANPQNNATKQAIVKAGKGGVIPPKDKQFGQPNGNPRHNGAWKKEDTPRYKLEQMLKLSESELREVLDDKDAPLFERRLAKSILTENEFKTSEAMINQVYGQPKQVQETKLEADLTGIDITFKNESKQ